MSRGPGYGLADTIAPAVAEQLVRHRDALPEALAGAAALPSAAVIAEMVDAAFWASLKREEGAVPTISLAYLPPEADTHRVSFASPLSLAAASLAKLGPAVEQPGIHIGVSMHQDALTAWGTTRAIPPLCFVVEVVGPGHIVLKHRPRAESGKFVNLAVIEGDAAKLVDAQASRMPGCPSLLAGLIDGDHPGPLAGQRLVELAVAMRAHRRGGTLLVVPGRATSWQDSIVTPIPYAVDPPFTALAEASAPDHVRRAVHTIAGFTAVDGATILTDQYALIGFGAKIRRRQGHPQVDVLLHTEPILGNEPTRMSPAQLGGTRHLSAAQFISDQREGLALVASQDGRFTLLAWSPDEQIVHAHRIDALLV